jgi:energy-coupling factor transporter ATP-binding protein EcfA2
MKSFAGITRLIAEGFRGATSRIDLELFPEQPFVLLFGENGSGKSTLVDAIEFALWGTKGSLGDFASTTLKHLGTLGTKSSPLHVQLQACGAQWTGNLAGSQARLSGSEARPRVEILRRSRLAKIVAAGATERFEQLDRFVNVEGVTASEVGLDRAAKEAKLRLQKASEEIAGAEAALRALWEEQGRPGDNTFGWARSAAVAQADVTQGGNLAQGWLSAAQLALNALALAHRQSGEASEGLEEALISLQSLDREPPAGSESGAEALIQLLAAARKFIASESMAESCPLCRQPVDTTELRAGIEARLSASQEQAEWIEKRAKTLAHLDTQRAMLERAQTDVSKAATDLVNHAAAAPPAIEPGIAKDLASAAAEAAQNTTFTPDSPIRSTLEGLAMRLTEVTRALVTESERCTQVARIWKQYDLSVQQGKTLEDESKRLARCLEIVRGMRQEFTDTLLNDVADEVNRLYRELHPNEIEIGGARFYLDPKQRASLKQVVKFGNADNLPPQACFSESHLLTLAFCLWLALAKRERPAETILVLDDVVHAIDAPHMQRLAMLLAIEREHFAQIIVTTHSRRFQRYLRDGLAPSGRLDIRTLRWSLQGGIVHGPSPHLAKQLETALSKPLPDRHIVASKGGVLLEAILRQLAVLYRRPVPFTEPTEPTLNELLDAWKDRDARRVTVEQRTKDSSSYVLVGTFGDVLTKLRGLSQIRNIVGAHSNTEADEVPDGEVETFGKYVLELWNLVVCTCGQIPRKAKDGAFICHCRHLRFRPDRLD